MISCRKYHKCLMLLLDVVFKNDDRSLWDSYTEQISGIRSGHCLIITVFADQLSHEKFF